MSDRYQNSISTGLEGAFRSARRLSFELEELRLVVFSDQHKGAGDDADDFRGCEAAYHAALLYYLEGGYSLAVAGDCEELWEADPQTVIEKYRWILSVENAFHAKARYWRLFGNHDDAWAHPDQVGRHLGSVFPQLRVLESLRIGLEDNGSALGDLFLVHGHQGTTFSDRLGWISRVIVRFIWRPFQRLTKIRASTPATDWKMRHKHDIAMYNWAEGRARLLLVAGHTHHPIFPSRDRESSLTAKLERMEASQARSSEVEQVRAELEMVKTQAQPTYFNTGCCSFSDGSATGIEIADGEIRLVRWTSADGRAKREVLEAAGLREVLAGTS